ncbi:hypothetical protein GCM10010909_20060 [Acidocella aquatica]|uniref:Cytochrome c domain-containing protein n=1 Tax=Acidocella aquatica TaxID=1922313 RepID=A0ABQ6AB84_9PROT|nr:cytochrome c [Acidocella aquatica]GLR67325.1 hypothetical protein GCM10010909_20060 [Acidocella aquatica]
MNAFKVTGLAAAGLLLATVAAMAATPPALYTQTQATAGAAVFAQSCAMCHGADLKGVAGPALIGPTFAAAGNKYTVGSVFTEIAQQMPVSAPGSLSHDQYTDIMAYILSKNGYPAGTAALDYTAGMASTVPFVSQVK